MDYYRNIDHFTCTDGFGRIGQSTPAVQELEYSVLADLAQEPVTNSDFKQHARVDFNTDDNLIAFYLKAAREYLEQWGVFYPTAVDGEVPISAHLLLGNYPNPFNPKTTIAFELPKRKTVTLRVFDMAGRLVRELIGAEVYTPGSHGIVWNGRDDNGRQVASGTYFYRLEAGSYSETKRMVLIK